MRVPGLRDGATGSPRRPDTGTAVSPYLASLNRKRTTSPGALSSSLNDAS